MKIAIVGATGLVGRELIQVLEQRNFPANELLPAASVASIGQNILFHEKNWKVRTLDKVLNEPDVQLAFFCTDAETSRHHIPAFLERGVRVIDNSSAWRLEADVPLVVPEVNPEALEHAQLVSNPNCSTIQLVCAMAPLHRRYGLRRLVLATYQSVTGSGQAGVSQLLDEREEGAEYGIYPHPIDLNCLPVCEDLIEEGALFLESGYTREEMKLVFETRKILRHPELAITATCVRVPVLGGHSEAVTAEFESDFDLDDVRNLLNESPGLRVLDQPAANLYPMPLFVRGQDQVLVGRIRRDISQPLSMNLWIVADNLRKGAATNAVQIAERMFRLASDPKRQPVD